MALMKIKEGRTGIRDGGLWTASIDVITVGLSRTMPPHEIDQCWRSRIEVHGDSAGSAKVLRSLVMTGLLDTDLFSLHEGKLRK